MPLPAIAVAGSSGHFGQHVTSIITSPQFSSLFSKIVLLSRKDTTSKNTHTTAPNVDYRQYHDTNLSDALRDVDILVNAVGSKGQSFKEKLVRCLPQTPVRIYFPSEYGVDHLVHDFPHPEWDKKKEHLALAEQILESSAVKICCVFCGLFLEDSIGPWFGFDTKNGKYEAVGSAGKPISFTSLDDVGRTVAHLATLPPQEIPDKVHVAGDTKSFREIADCMTAAGAGPIEIKEIDLKPFKEKAVETPTPDPAQCLRFLMGEGKIDHTIPGGLGNDNAFLDPGQKFWKWKTSTDLGRETGGKPWT